MNTADIAYCALFAALMAVGAYIKIVLPLGPFSVTISLQVFFAVLAGLLLGPKRGFISVLSYLLIGLMGAPVFAHGGGFSYIARPTFGFLLGFAAAAFVSGAAAGRLQRQSTGSLFFAAFLGEMAYYFCGLFYYGIMFHFVISNGETIGLFELLAVWGLSTIVPDTVIVFFAVVLAKRLRRVLPELRVM